MKNVLKQYQVRKIPISSKILIRILKKSSFSYPHLSSFSSKKPSVSSFSSTFSSGISHVCKHCDKTFSSYKNKWRHEKTCNAKGIYTREEIDEVIAERFADKLADKDTIIHELKRQIEVLLSKVGDTHIQNTTYNIVLNAFGKENISYIQEGYVKNLIKQGPYTCIPKLIKAIHFDPDHQENHNIKIPNKNKPIAKIYDGDSWEFKNKKEAETI